jgi:2-polyprenyl-3-methyl-5-hydroxy-6-metoxy-1,4-benzoquinol methylase
MILSDNELKEYNDAQKNYREGRGYSVDTERFERYFYYINKFNKKWTTVLDVGCGPGPLEVYLDKYGYKNVEAIDFSDEGISICKRNTPNFNYTVGNISDIKNIYTGRTFDIVFCCQVLEHLPNYRDIFKQLYDLTTGILIISVPWDKCKNNDRHINHFVPRSFHELAESIGVNENIIITERFGENNLQLLVVFIKEK